MIHEKYCMFSHNQWVIKHSLKACLLSPEIDGRFRLDHSFGCRNTEDITLRWLFRHSRVALPPLPRVIGRPETSQCILLIIRSHNYYGSCNHETGKNSLRASGREERAHVIIAEYPSQHSFSQYFSWTRLTMLPDHAHPPSSNSSYPWLMWALYFYHFQALETDSCKTLQHS